MRLMGTWLGAGVREDGVMQHPERGGVQGGVRSPVWANVFWPHGLDAWFEREGRPRLKGGACLRRFADDFCIGGARATDARRIMAVRPKRCGRLGLTIPPEKTTLLAFRQPEGRQALAHGKGTCEGLGWTHDWTRSRRGFGVLTRSTARKRLRRTKQSLGRGCRANRHAPAQDHDQMLGLKRRGHLRSDGIRGHCRLLTNGRRYAEKAWWYWLSRRRSQRALSGEPCQRLLRTDVLPTPTIVHPI
jgi:RNA-directed DNA polymerase